MSHYNYAILLENKFERYGEAEEHYCLLDGAAQEGAGRSTLAMLTRVSTILYWFLFFIV